MSGSNWFITGSNSANAAGSITPGSFIVLSQRMTSQRLLDTATLKKKLSISQSAASYLSTDHRRRLWS